MFRDVLAVGRARLSGVAPVRKAAQDTQHTALWSERRGVDVHFQRTSPSDVARAQAFTLMSSALAEAIAVVRAAGAVLREREEELAKCWGGEERPQG